MFKLQLHQNTQNRVEKMIDTYKRANKYRYAKTDTERLRYASILKEFYDEECRRRFVNAAEIGSDQKKMQTCLEYISQREAIGDFIVDWCWGYDPRNAGLGLPPIFPLIPFEMQFNLIEWVYNLYFKQESGMIEKSRDEGASVFLSLVTLFEWRWTKGFAGGVGSNKLENVDKRGNPGCLFEKFRFFLKTLPSWWLPRGFIDRQHDKMCNLINPEMGCQIAGQGGRDIGRGDRRAFYWVDEKASLDFPEEADMALSQTTRCQIDLSTPKGANSFERKIHSGRYPVYTMHWREDPRKNQEWYEHECDRLDLEIVAQEIDINYHSSVEGLFIRPEWVDAAFRVKLEPKGEAVAGFDVAAGGKNVSALTKRWGPVGITQAYNIENGIQLTHEVIDECNKGGIDTLHFDKIGVGHVVTSSFDSTEMPVNFEVYGLDAGGRASDRVYKEFDGAKGFKIFLNARAEWWYMMAARLKYTYDVDTGVVKSSDQTKMIELEKNQKLKSQLCSVKKLRTESGKIKAESKQSLIGRGISSPDEADSAVMAYIPTGGGSKHLAQNYSSGYLEDVTIEWGKVSRYNCYNYGSISLKQDMSVDGIYALWHEFYGRLYVYGEVEREYINTIEFTETLAKDLKLNTIICEKIIGNDLMFKDNRRSFVVEMNDQLYEKSPHQAIMISRPYRYDPIGSVGILNRLIDKGGLVIDRGCKNLHNSLRKWTLTDQKVKAEGSVEALLMVVSQLVQVIPIEEILKMIEYKPKVAKSVPPKKIDKGV